MDARTAKEHDWDEEDIHAAERQACRVKQPETLASGHATPPIGETSPTAIRETRQAVRGPGQIAMPHKNNSLNFPGFIARSSMFRATRSKSMFEKATRVPVAGGSMTVSGPALCMRDKAVWEATIQLAKERARHVGDAFEVELREIARRVGSRDFSGKSLSSMWSSLERLAKTRVEFEIDNGRCVGVGSLLSTAIKSEGRTRLRLNPDFAIPALIHDKQFLFNLQRRNALSSSLAQWLHDYYTTHKTAQSVDLRYLRGLCGDSGAPRNFPAKLREAMDELQSKAPGLIASYSIDSSTRCSDTWMLDVAKGPETPSFLPAGRHLSPPPSKGRRGVAL